MAILRVCHIGTFSPTQCGIATFAEDLNSHMRDTQAIRIRMVRVTEEWQPGFECEVGIDDLRSYEQAGEFINLCPASVVSLQHDLGYLVAKMVNMCFE